jgi:mono/diheme cytochrome c family protein
VGGAELRIQGWAAVAVFLCFGVAMAGLASNAEDPRPVDLSEESVSLTPPPGMAGDVLPGPAQMTPQVARGEYLATAGDCMYCHSIPGGPPYAGGQALQSPFGDLFSPNITPDKTYGIGNWTDAQFYNAVHNGIGKGHSLLIFPRYLYPVMPWQDYSKLSYADVMAIKAYLDTLTPVAEQNRPTQMHFPFTLRAGLLAWRILFFHPQPVQYDPSWSPSVRNGAFLVQALGHCSECHTPRNLAMATESSHYLAGGHILAQSWYAPNISASKTDGVGGWAQADLVKFLWRDGSLGTGAAYGPMKEVVDDSLSRLPESDIADIAAYLQTATPDQKSAAPTAVVADADGAALYAANCARCHGDNGEGVAQNFPNLAGNESVWDGPAEDVESMILGGFEPWHQNQSAMPAFGQMLSNDQIAAVTNYVRTSWGNKGVADATGTQVGQERGTASEWAVLSTGTAQASLGGMVFDDIAGTFELFGDRANCMLTNGRLSGGGQTVTIYGGCGHGGGSFQGQMTVGTDSYPVSLQMQEEIADNGIAAVVLSGSVHGAPFTMRIAFVKAED